MYCAQCGKPMPDGAMFCTNCGWRTQAQNEEIKNSNKNKNVGIICALIAASVAAYLLFQFFVNI